MSTVDALAAVIAGGRCWGIELEPRFRVLAVTVEPDPPRAPGTVGPLQLLCFPVAVLLVTVTRPVEEAGRSRTAVVTFDLEDLTAVSERFAGAALGAGSPFGSPEPRPGSWGPRHSLEGRTSAADGTRTTLTLDLTTEDGARLRLFARFDDAELRDERGESVLGTAADGQPTHGLGRRVDEDGADPLRF
jgi:hypothetical protein